MTKPLFACDATELLAGYASGAFTPTEVMRALNAHIARWEPALGALYLWRPEQAEIQAAAATARWRQGRPMGALDGIPVTVKELIATAGDPVPLGTAAVERTPAPADAPCAARLREAGAIIFAKTTIPDYGMLSSGLSSFHTLARNPWNLATNPGGSSAGASAATAACYGPIHVGTDIGGSVRLPAAWCGTVGFKPTLGRIPIDPYYTGRCAGPITRNMADAALAMGPLTLPDPRDATSLPYEAIDWAAAPLPPRGLRVGVMLDAGCGLPVDAEIAAAVKNAATLFARAGALVADAPPVLTREILDGIDVFWRAKFWDEVRRLPDARRERILPYILEWVSAGARVTGAEAARGFSGTFTLRRACAALFDEVDVVISPTTPNLSFPADWASPTNDPSRPFEHCAFTLPWNMSEQPALTLNCGVSRSGTPIGLQIVTRRFADLQAIRLGRWFEREYGRIPHWPGDSVQPPSLA